MEMYLWGPDRAPAAGLPLRAGPRRAGLGAGGPPGGAAAPEQWAGHLPLPGPVTAAPGALRRGAPDRAG